MKFSIITITYNSDKTLLDTIESVKKQGYKDLEYIIIDGGSTDKTLDYIKQNNEVVTKWISEKDAGISDAFNKGISMASGDIIGIINSDDMLADDALNKINNSIKENTDVIYGNAISFGENITPFLEKPSMLENLYSGMSLIHPSVFIKRSAYEKYGIFDLKYKCCMDRELLLRMYTKGAQFQYINEVLAMMRQGGTNQRNYLTNTIPEGEEISIRYGMKPCKARLISKQKKIKFIVKGAIEKTVLNNTFNLIRRKLKPTSK